MPKIEELSTITIERVKKERKNLGVTQRFFAPAIGCSNGAYGNYEAGVSPFPDRYKSRAIDVIIALKYLKDGYKLKPVSEETQKTIEPSSNKKDILDTLDMLKENIKSVDNKIIRSVSTDYIEKIKQNVEEL